MKRCSVTIVLTAAALSGFAQAATVHVDADGGGDYATIGEGVAAATAGDTVFVGPGTYTGPLNREIDFLGKNLVVISHAGPDQTIVDCQSAGRAFVFHMREDENCVLQGLTIRNGLSTTGFSGEEGGEGGAVWCGTASPRILECTFIANSAEFGGAIYCGVEACPDIEFCSFSDNLAEGYGGAIYTYGARLYVMECDFEQNHAGINGGALSIKERTVAKVMNSRFRENEAADGGAIYIGTLMEDPGQEDPEYSTVGFSSFFENSAERGGAIYLNSYSWVNTVWCTLVRNSAAQGGGLFALTDAMGELSVQNCTFCFNYGENGGAVCVAGESLTNQLVVTDTILAFSSLGNSLHRMDWGPVTTVYCLAYGNEGGDVLYGELNMVGEPYDPLFCDAYEDNYNLCVGSPARNFHGRLIGSQRQTCSSPAYPCTSPVEDITWGSIKAMFR